MLKDHWETLVIDCTYKTNKFKMPLCIVTGTTSLNTSFYVAFCFMTEEYSDDYLWLLQQLALLYLQVDVPHPIVILTDGERGLISMIHRVFPRAKNLLCVWHVNKNVVKNCKKSFNTEEKWVEFYAEWQNIVHSPTEASFDAQWDSFHAKWIEYTDCLDYLADLLFRFNHRRKIITCWTDKVLHFGNTATSRGEGAHWVLKRNLSSSTGDLKSVVDSIDFLLRSQRQEYIGAINKAKSRIPLELKLPWMQEVIAYVTPYALRKILHHYQNIIKQQEENAPPRPCTKQFTTTMGLPCGHRINELLRSDPPGVLHIDDINPHWRYQKPLMTAEHRQEAPPSDDNIDPLLRVRDPPVIKPKGRPPGARNKRKAEDHARSTHRDPSGFEYVEQEFDASQRSTQPARPAKRSRPRRQQNESINSSRTMEGGGVMSVFRL